MPTLIQCPACQKNVSTQAAACPNCGQPLNAMLSDDVQTVEQTGKKLKLHAVLSLCLFFGSIPWMIFASGIKSDVAMIMGVLAFVGGLGWYSVNRMNIWWKHR